MVYNNLVPFDLVLHMYMYEERYDTTQCECRIGGIAGAFIF